MFLFIKSVLIGLAASALTYFALFALMMASLGIMQIAKFVAIGVGIWVMVSYQKEN